MFTGLWIIGAISWGIVGSADWKETLYLEDELVSRTQCSLRFEQGWRAEREMEFETIRAHWPTVTPKVQWSQLYIEAVHHDLKGQLVQIDTEHFQHRLEYKNGFVVGIHTRDPWEEHHYEVIWRDGLPVKLVGYLERIHLVYNSKRHLTQITETWLDEPEMKKEVMFISDDIDPRYPLPFSMGWLFTREGKMNPRWLAAWWLSKQRYPDSVASALQD